MERKAPESLWRTFIQGECFRVEGNLLTRPLIDDQLSSQDHQTNFMQILKRKQ